MFPVVSLFFIPLLSAFNIDTKFPIVYSDPTQPSNKSSYFGYSLALYPGKKDTNQSWIFIGAPRSQNSKLAKFRNPGVFYKCPIKQECEEVDVSGSRFSLNSFYSIKLDDAWIGGSMDINLNTERVAVCAHRWVDQSLGKKLDYRMHGSCYWFHAHGSTLETLMPLSDGYDIIHGVYYHGQGQAGTSVHMPADGTQLLMGAPGIYNWDGAPILFQDRHRKPFKDQNIADTILTRETLAYELLGYSGTSGHFYGTRQLYYVSGAPKSGSYHGKVLVYVFNQATNATLVIKEVKQGNQFGEYFGASLTAGDVNRDGFDDLVVGAPFHYGHKYNEGKVYIFMGSRNGLSDDHFLVGKEANGQFGTCVQFLGDINADGYGDLAVSAPYEDENHGVVYLYKGTSGGIDNKYSQRLVGRDIFDQVLGFGISISRAADIDHNGFADVAIGAYMSGHVVVLRTRPVAIIHHNIYSLTSKLDISQKTTKMFNITSCLWLDQVSLDKNPELSVAVRRRIVVDEELGRGILLDAKVEEVVNLTAEEPFCQIHTIVYESTFSNQSFTVSMAHELVPPPEENEVVLVSKGTVSGSDGFCPSCAVYDGVRSSSPAPIHIPFTLNCGSDNVCRSSLQFELKLDVSDSGFVLGSQNTVRLTVVITNFGENSYSTKMTVVLPESVDLQSTPSNCVEQDLSSLTCDVDDPLESNQTESLTLYLDMTKVNDGLPEDVISFKVSVQTSSENDLNDTKTVRLKLKRDADVAITGQTKEEFYFYKNKDRETNFSHIFWVRTFGLSPLDELSVEFNVPHFIKTKDRVARVVSLHPLRGRLDDKETITCKSDFDYVIDMTEDGGELGEIFSDEKIKARKKRSDLNHFENQTLDQGPTHIPPNHTFYINCSKVEVVCTKVVCTIRSIRPGQIARIEMDLILNLSAVKGFLNKSDVILFATQGHVTVTKPLNFVGNSDGAEMVDITSLFIGANVKEVIPLWIVIVSVAVGLLLLLLLILGLIKAGFFKRKAKEELEQLKMEMEFQEEIRQSS